MINSVKGFSQINKNTATIFSLIKCFFDCFSKMNYCKGGRVFLTGEDKKCCYHLKTYTAYCA